MLESQIRQRKAISASFKWKGESSIVSGTSGGLAMYPLGIRGITLCICSCPLQIFLSDCWSFSYWFVVGCCCFFILTNLALCLTYLLTIFFLFMICLLILFMFPTMQKCLVFRAKLIHLLCLLNFIMFRTFFTSRSLKLLPHFPLKMC